MREDERGVVGEAPGSLQVRRWCPQLMVDVS